MSGGGCFGNQVSGSVWCIPKNTILDYVYYNKTGKAASAKILRTEGIDPIAIKPEHCLNETRSFSQMSRHLHYFRLLDEFTTTERHTKLLFRLFATSLSVNCNLFVFSICMSTSCVYYSCNGQENVFVIKAKFLISNMHTMYIF